MPIPHLPNLPIQEVLPEIKLKLARQGTLLLQAPPGAGKSTLVPLALLEETWLKDSLIIMLEPRRLAAKSVAERMASLLGEKVGQTVGYTIRFERKISNQTRIEVVTEGVLTRRLQQDSTLDGVGLIIFDEFHERSLHADIGLALCREIQQVLREDLRLLVMSATLDIQPLANLLTAPVLHSHGRQYPIAYHYEPADQQLPLYKQTAIAVRSALQRFEGDVLVFLPGAGDIRRTAEALEGSTAKICMLYGQLPSELQQEALLPDRGGRRKVVLATSIAETSLTIEGVKVVIDSGWAKLPRFNRRTGFTRLEKAQITLDTADQRAGRAGRLGPGVCIRMWSKTVHQHLVPHRRAEIQEADLASLVLELANWGTDWRDLVWLDPPAPIAIQQAEEMLLSLGAITNEGNITNKGKRLLAFPAHPRLADLLLTAQIYGYDDFAPELLAILEERDPMAQAESINIHLRLQYLKNLSSDKFAPKAWAPLLQAAKQWTGLLKSNDRSHKSSKPVAVKDRLGHLLSLVYPERIAKQLSPHSERYQLVSGQIVRLPANDPLLSEPWLVIPHLDSGSGDGRAFLAVAISLPMIEEHGVYEEEVEWNHQTGLLEAQQKKKLGKIVLEAQPLPNISLKLRQEALSKAIRSSPELLDWSGEVEQWQARVMSAKKWRSLTNWPAVSKEELLAVADQWLVPFIAHVRKKEQFKKISLIELLPSLLSYEQQQELAQWVPQKIQVPSGSWIKLQYDMEGGMPVLAVRLQELFGLKETPTVNQGAQAVLIHMLSPGYKPVQVTQDLTSFWDNTYAEVRKELRRRYSKHHWPDNPWEATAVSGAKRRK